MKNVEKSRNTPDMFKLYSDLEKFLKKITWTEVEKAANFPVLAQRQAITKFLERYELFKLIHEVPGSILECGVANGFGLMSFAHLCSVFEGYHYTRKLFGFDTFEGFTQPNIKDKTSGAQHMKKHGLKFPSYEILKKMIEFYDRNRALGSSVKGKKVGSIADSSIFSFCGNKVLTTGEGGAIVTNTKEIYEKLKLIRSHGRVDAKNYFDDIGETKYLGIGYNWRMSTITACLGITQLAKLDKIIKMRQENAKHISSNLSKFSEIQVLEPPNDYEHIYQMYTIRLIDKNIRDKLQKYLFTKKIFSKVYFNPIHLSSYYKKEFNTYEGMLPVTEKISEQVLTLPIYPNMTHEEKTYLTDSISEFFESNNKN